MAFVVREYIDDAGRIPFREWLKELDTVTRARVQSRVLRFELGNGGVWEARMAFGPGYRLYFGRKGRELVLLLTGGDKKSQRSDIRRARELWTDYLKEQRNG